MHGRPSRKTGRPEGEQGAGSREQGTGAGVEGLSAVGWLVGSLTRWLGVTLRCSCVPRPCVLGPRRTTPQHMADQFPHSSACVRACVRRRRRSALRTGAADRQHLGHGPHDRHHTEPGPARTQVVLQPSLGLETLFWSLEPTQWAAGPTSAPHRPHFVIPRTPAEHARIFGPHRSPHVVSDSDSVAPKHASAGPCTRPAAVPAAVSAAPASLCLVRVCQASRSPRLDSPRHSTVRVAHARACLCLSRFASMRAAAPDPDCPQASEPQT